MSRGQQGFFIEMIICEFEELIMSERERKLRNDITHDDVFGGVVT